MENVLQKSEDERISLTEQSYFKSPNNQNHPKNSEAEVDLELDKLLITGNKEQAYIPFPTKNIYSKNDFEVLELLGKGAYAKVVKAKCLRENMIKAIKIIDRHFMERENKLYQVYLENDILHRINHNRVVKIDGIFEENDKIFIVMEYLSNGDFFRFLKLNAPLKYETVQFFIAEIVESLEFLHSQKIYHRDIKPENIMLDENFHIKLIDFATSKIEGKYFDEENMNFVDQSEELRNSRKDSDEIEYKKKSKHTFVGTADYVSPEVLIDQPANHEVDLWALGCIIYQCFTGNTPFKEKTEYLIFKKILELDYEFPEDFPEKAKDLVKCLLLTDPSKRLGSGSLGEENNFKALKLHPFFTGIDFDTLKKINPPNKKEFKAYVNSGSVKNKFNGTRDNNFMTGSHKNTMEVVKEEIIEKKSPWFHYNTRKVVLYNVPKIEYIDPSNNLVKGVIYLTNTCYAEFVDYRIFLLVTPNRTFKFRTPKYEAGVWVKKINETIEKCAKN